MIRVALVIILAIAVAYATVRDPIPMALLLGLLSVGVYRGLRRRRGL